MAAGHPRRRGVPFASAVALALLVAKGAGKGCRARTGLLPRPETMARPIPRARAAAATPAAPGATTSEAGMEEPPRGPAAPRGGDDICAVYPRWPPLPDSAEDPGTVLRMMAEHLLSVPTPVMGRRVSYDFLRNEEASTGLFEWRAAAWAWRDFVASTILAPYDAEDAAARLSAASTGAECEPAASRQPVASLRATLEAVLRITEGARSSYPKLAAVLKFVPKKNGLNPLLKQLADGDTDLGLDALGAREFEHLARDARRSFNQCFLLLTSFATLPRELSSEMLWCARVVCEKVKTDQRTRALEVLCAGTFSVTSPLFDIVECVSVREPFEAVADELAWSARSDSKALRAWERMRMVYPYLQVAYLAAQSQTPPTDDGLSPAQKRAIADAEAAMAAAPDASAVSGAGVTAGDVPAAPDVEGVPCLLRNLADSEEKTINSLLYWMLDILYRRALASQSALGLPRTQFIVEMATTRATMWATIADAGRLVGTLVGLARADLSGDTLRNAVKRLEAQTTLLQSVRDATTAGLWRGKLTSLVSQLICQYDATLAAAAKHRLLALPPSLVERAGLGALGVLLQTPYEAVAARAGEVNAAMLEWRNPELLFRYYEDNLADEEMAPVVRRWLRAVFGMSRETTQDIRRRDAANRRHLNAIGRRVLRRWYSKSCPGTSSTKTLFMVGEDAGSCLRVTSTLGNKFNRALMGYLLQSHVRALVVTDSVRRVLARSLIRLLLRSDSLEPVIYCDHLFFAAGHHTPELWGEIRAQAAQLEAHMRIPVVHACSALPPRPVDEANGGYVREVVALGYHVVWVDLLEVDGVSPYTYSEDQPWDEMLDQHVPGLLRRTQDKPALTIAALPLADSPSASEYVLENRGRTAWTQGEAAVGSVPPSSAPPAAASPAGAASDQSWAEVPASAVPGDVGGGAGPAGS